MTKGPTGDMIKIAPCRTKRDVVWWNVMSAELASPDYTALIMVRFPVWGCPVAITRQL